MTARKRAIDKPARQLAGAESFLRRFPRRIFIDKDCHTPLPAALPDPSVACYFLVAVTRGSHRAAVTIFGGGSTGSLMLNSQLEGDAHHGALFEVGFPTKGRRFVQVLDEMTVDALLDELDTVPDLVACLECKEAYFGTQGVVMRVAGEEELLAQYVCRMEDGKHALPKIPAGADAVSLLERNWKFYWTNHQLSAKREADAGSYMRDSLIDYQASFIGAGEAIGLPDTPPETIDHERVLRALPSETRFSRRELAAPPSVRARAQRAGQEVCPYDTQR